MSVQDEWSSAVRELEARLRVPGAERRAVAVAELLELLRFLDAELTELTEESLLDKDRVKAFEHAASLLSQQPRQLRGDDSEALLWLQRAWQVADKSEDHGLRAYAALKLGGFLFRTGQLDQAVNVLETAIETCERDLGSRHQIHILLAQIARVRGFLEQGFEHLNAAQEILDRIDANWPFRPTVEADLLGMRSTLFVALGNPDHALSSIRALKELAAETGRDDIAARAHLHAAKVSLAFGRFDDVESEVTLGLSLLEGGEVSGLFESISMMGALASLYREPDEGGDPERAETQIRAVLATESVPLVERMWAEAAFIDFLIRHARYEEAGEGIARVRSEMGELFTTEGDGPLERGAVLASLEAALAVERGDEPAALLPRLQELEAAFDRFLEQWESAPRPDAGVGFLEYQTRRRIVSEVLRLSVRAFPGEEGIRRALAHLERAQAHGSIARGSGYGSRSLEELRAALTSESRGLVAYMPGPYRTHAFLLDAKELHYAELPGILPLERLRKEFLAACSTQPGEQTPPVLENKAARELSAALLPPDFQALCKRWSELYIIGSTLIGYVPFEFLPVDGVYLGEELAIAYLPSIPVGMLLTERATKPEASPVGDGVDHVLIAAPTFDASVRDQWPQVTPLPFGEEERKLLSAAYEPSRSVVITGDEATRERLHDEAVGSAEVLQILTHGVLDFDRERPTGLVMTGGEEDRGLLWCEDVEGLRAPPLTLLWSCGAGFGPLRRGEDGLSSLGDAFLAAGSQSVLVSSGRLEYRALLQLAAVFHERLVENGDAPAEALRHARQSLVVTDPQRAHPFYTLVHVVGLGHDPISIP